MRRVLGGSSPVSPPPGSCAGCSAAGRRRRETVAVGYTDGASVVLDVGSPERELLLATAADAL